jgi:hypothetical protein
MACSTTPLVGLRTGEGRSSAFLSTHRERGEHRGASRKYARVVDLPNVREVGDHTSACHRYPGIPLGGLAPRRARPALGARVYPEARDDIGWFEVTLDDVARADALLSDATRTHSISHPALLA